MSICYIALGSNLGDRAQNLSRALEHLRSLGTVITCSSVYETEPREYLDQPFFLNAVVALDTEVSATDLMRQLLRVEKQLGRERSLDVPPKGPRAIDLDVLLYGDEVISSEEIEAPHPRLHERLFVLEPLTEIAPELWHPLLGRTMAELRDALAIHESAGSVRIFSARLC